MLKENRKQTTSQTLLASVRMLNVNDHGSAIRKQLNKTGLFRKVARKKPLLSNMNSGVG